MLEATIAPAGEDAARATSDLYSKLAALPFPTSASAMSEDYRKGMQAGWEGAVHCVRHLANDVFRDSQAAALSTATPSRGVSDWFAGDVDCDGNELTAVRSDTLKALYRRACEVVRHDNNCPAVGGAGDCDCRCDAVPFLRDFAAQALSPREQSGLKENDDG